MQYKERPRVIEAGQYIFGNPLPKGMCNCDAKGGVPHIHAPPNGDVVEVQPTEWVLVEKNGDVSTCSADRFTALYEPLAPPTP